MKSTVSVQKSFLVTLNNVFYCAYLFWTVCFFSDSISVITAMMFTTSAYIVNMCRKICINLMVDLCAVCLTHSQAILIATLNIPRGLADI